MGLLRHVADRSTRVLIGLLVLASLVSLVAGVLAFLQTREPASSLLLGLAFAVLFATLAVVAWVAEDARQVGLPRLPWMAAILLAPGVGFVGYLVETR